VPLFAFDQVVNGERVAAAGAGVLLPGGPISAPEIPSALTRVLAEPAYRAAARAVAADIAALPDVAASVPVLEELAEAV
jgi:UDP:flavonoid glycosyltransferase YjiC (YdhE family)